MEMVPVGTLVRFIREWIEVSEAFSDVWAVGEISNYSRSSAGHQYFTLKDDSASLRIVLFRGDDRGVPLASGDHVIVHGRVSVYEARGELQFVCDFVRPEGVGIMAARFEELRERLEREGLFDIARKRPLPPFPMRIGLMTSPTGAALQDIRNVLSKRWPLAELVFSPALVQGNQAPRSIVAALDRLATEPGLDLVIVARGGGSAEDLAAFNDEAVARAVFAFPVPVVSGVGHETDTSIVDFVADLRAPTPSAAAERCTPDRSALLDRVSRTHAGMLQAVQRDLRDAREQILRQVEQMRDELPDTVALQADCARLLHEMRRALGHRLRQSRSETEGTAARLQALSPIATLGRGYAIVQEAASGRVVRRTRQVKAGMRLIVGVHDGAFGAEVN